ncbi:uncharacterized protein LOC105916453 isoform X1 [Fundulus heteroclitus]|uniref:uncharacterized protein LOC105916453 isoform X1 n=1 Tax=Fundulus heteroclitus TaxID=8078 RepID=UPI00165AD3BD|nr:uncharacterized protein LOC105916453 isoform X1 [Fundulus heteroclitus]
MASGFCVSMLMLSLITVGMHAAGNVHRYGSKTVRPHSAQAGTLPRSYRPAPSSYEGSLRPRASVASSKIPGRLSAESSKPWGSVAGHGQSGYGRQVNSYSQPRSVSSYRSTSVLTPQQQPQARVYQRPSVREPSSQGEKRYGSSVVSSGAIEIRAPEKPSQVPSSSPGTGVRKTKAKTLDSVNAQLAKSPGSAAQPPKNHPAFSAPAVLQTNKAMWDSINAPSAKSPGSAAQPPKNHPAFSAPAVLQTNKAMWGSINAPSAKSPASTVQRHKRPSSVPGVLQANPGQLPIYTSSATSPHSTSQRHQKPSPFSAPVVQQTNQRWGGMFSNPRSSRPVASGYYRGLQSGHPAARQQERMLTRQPMHLGSPATSVRQNKDVSSFPQMKPGLRSSRPVNMASLYQHGGRLPQLSYNRD